MNLVLLSYIVCMVSSPIEFVSESFKKTEKIGSEITLTTSIRSIQSQPTVALYQENLSYPLVLNNEWITFNWSSTHTLHPL